MIDKELINLNLKYNRFLKYKPFFDFKPQINNKYDFNVLYNKEMEITHKACGKKHTIKLSEWMHLHSKNKGVSKIEYKYLCNYCSQEEKNEKFQKKLDIHHNGFFKLVSNYNGVRKYLSILHTECGKTFELVPMYNKIENLKCRECGETSFYKKTKITEDKDIEFRNKLLENGFINIIPLEKFESNKKEIKFKHLYCNNIFKKTPESLLQLQNKNICPKCDDYLPNASSPHQENRNKYFQGRLNRLYGNKIFELTGDYNGNKSDVKIKHLKCGFEYTIYAPKILNGKYKCFCEDSKYGVKSLNSITISEKIKLYENVLNNEYKILTPFITSADTTKIKHKKCGHEFERTVHTFLRSKGRILCPQCSKKQRFEKYKKQVEEKYQNEYTITENIPYKDYRSDIEVIHNKCNKKFISNFNILLNDSLKHCPHCNKRITSDKEFKKQVYDKFKGEYLVTSPYINHSTPIYFRHKKCGKRFSLTSRKFLMYVTPCPDCRLKKKSLSIKEAQEKVNNKFGNLFKICGIYKNMHTKLPIKCNQCGNIIEYSIVNLLNRTKCPCCKTKYL